eukprot:scaffold473_cov104-Isochrysis_galbana.AAC.5
MEIEKEKTADATYGGCWIRAHAASRDGTRERADGSDGANRPQQILHVGRAIPRVLNTALALTDLAGVEGVDPSR